MRSLQHVLGDEQDLVGNLTGCVGDVGARSPALYDEIFSAKGFQSLADRLTGTGESHAQFRLGGKFILSF